MGDIKEPGQNGLNRNQENVSVDMAKEEDDEPKTALGKELKRILGHLEKPEAWPDAKPAPDVDWEELVRTHPAFRDISLGG